MYQTQNQKQKVKVRISFFSFLKVWFITNMVVLFILTLLLVLAAQFGGDGISQFFDGEQFILALAELLGFFAPGVLLLLLQLIAYPIYNLLFKWRGGMTVKVTVHETLKER